ncbi:serine/threonine protein kinase [Methylobacterium crusticola]|uniref:serine/threonine protein kinase n=1 Tax=Methylobacterium crusticola TaxID=1697972 RepID=UPI000FFB6D57|nr:protein kinase [Methylobacterium crusticola]
MAKKLKVGDSIRGYRIQKVFGPGMMAISYGAQAPSGAKVFFKQYKSPAPTVVWYKAYVNYQRELSARVRDGKAGRFAVRQVDAFEEIWGGRCYFQVYEFVDNGADLQQVLDEEREQHRQTKTDPTSDPAIWTRHVTWAKVFMAGMTALHDAKVVHADLKPANAYLIKDTTIDAGYQLKLIDMDFSLLSDHRAPWHGHQGYVGTDNYRSPEHLVKGGVPVAASDVFTCGLMLYELLAGYHPYWSDDQGEYAKLVLAHAAKSPTLLGNMPAPANAADVSSTLHRCLSPDLAARPTAAELRAVLSGRDRKPSVETVRSPSLASGTDASASAGPGPRAPQKPLVSNAIELVAPGGRSLRLSVRTELGKALMRQFGPDSEFWDNQQCVLERRPTGQWVLAPVGSTTNETLVNGQTLTAARALSAGDLIAVGRQAKGVAKLPLTVRPA